MREYTFVIGYREGEVKRICKRLIGREPMTVKFQHGPDIGKRLILVFKSDLIKDEKQAIDAQFSRMGYTLLEDEE